MVHVVFFFFYKQKTAYELCISDWCSDVCSSDLAKIQTACRSTASILLLAGVLKKKTFVFCLIAAFHASLARASTQVVSIPNLGSNVSVSQRQEPNSARPATDRKSTRLNSSH